MSHEPSLVCRRLQDLLASLEEKKLAYQRVAAAHNSLLLRQAGELKASQNDVERVGEAVAQLRHQIIVELGKLDKNLVMEGKAVVS